MPDGFHLRSAANTRAETHRASAVFSQVYNAVLSLPLSGYVLYLATLANANTRRSLRTLFSFHSTPTFIRSQSFFIENRSVDAVLIKLQIMLRRGDRLVAQRPLYLFDAAELLAHLLGEAFATDLTHPRV